jgi:serine/threonine protein kinase
MELKRKLETSGKVVETSGKPENIGQMSKDACLSAVGEKIEGKELSLRELLDRLEGYANAAPGEAPLDLLSKILAHYAPDGNIVGLILIGGESYTLSFTDNIGNLFILKIARPKSFGFEAPTTVGFIKGFSDEGRKIKAKTTARTRFEEGCKIQSRLAQDVEAAGVADFTFPGGVNFSTVPTLHVRMVALDGHSILDEVRERKDVIFSLRLFVKTINAVEFAHARGFIHRDLKAANIWFTSRERVAVLDWTEGTDMQRDNTLPGTALGSLRTAAPEQLEDAREADELSDIYSLGVVLWEIVQQQSAPKPQNLNLKIVADKERYTEFLKSRLPETFHQIFSDATQTDPAQRFPDCATFRTAVLLKIKQLEIEQNICSVEFPEKIVTLDSLVEKIRELETVINTLKPRCGVCCHWEIFLKKFDQKEENL